MNPTQNTAPRLQDGHPIKQSYLPLSCKITLLVLAFIAIIGSSLGTYFLYQFIGYVSLYCLTGEGVGIALLAVCAVLSIMTRESKIPIVRSITPQKDFDLQKANQCLKQTILQTPKYTQTENALAKSLYTPVHCLFEGVYLGNLRAFLSTDPSFLAKHTVVETLEELRGIVSKEEYTKMAKGSSELNIKLIISVTDFKALDTVPEDDWSKFIPDLETLKIQRHQIHTHDDDDAWENIEKELETVFALIDQARTRGENILIHCVEGSSRSSAVVYAYLMKSCGVTLDEALNFVVNKRPHVQIKSIMEQGLKEYYKQLHLS